MRLAQRAAHGHFFGAATGPSFTAELRVQADYAKLYDQAGIMVRDGAACWLKAGMEYTDGHPALGSVLTNPHDRPRD